MLAGTCDTEYKGSVAQEYLIGVDLGTSAVKAGLYDAAGNLIAAATRPAPLRQPSPGVAEQDAEEFAAAAAASIGEVMSRARAAPAQVAGLACAGQMGGAMGVDRGFQPLTPWYPSGLDGRYLPHQQQLAARAGVRLIELCGDLPIMGAAHAVVAAGGAGAVPAHRQGGHPGRVRRREDGRTDGGASLRRSVLSHLDRG